MAVQTTIKVMLPSMGESVTEGTVLEWHKRVGEAVQADEALVDISTDKVDVEVSAPTSGTVVQVHFEEGDAVSVGAVLAEIAPDGAGPTVEDASPLAEDASAPADGGDGAAAEPDSPPTSAGDGNG
ncbi:MAG: biotin/lipoyl-binding protein, partial [Actinomycetota bacterium]|nr:biotin/lipoyl-binding protein [Actinomycetota bacterium]